jgi:antitoxin ParD1/3/4
MTQLTVDMPPALDQWVSAKIAEGRYADAADYLRDLVRRDQEHGADERAWLRAQIQEGLDSGILDQDPRDIIDELIAEDPDLRG